MAARYVVSLTKRAEREKRKLPEEVKNRVEDALRRLAENPRPSGCRKLQNSEEWRIRLGDYRVRYTIDDENSTVTITRIAHRRDVY